MQLRLLLAVGILAAFFTTAAAGEQDADKKSKPLTTADCEKLVKQLVNPNKEPFKEPYVLDLPKGLTEEGLIDSFKKIGDAYDTLSKNAAVALPILMKHIGDWRYSFVQEQPGSGVFSKIAVGSACARIVSQHVEAHLKETFCHDGEGRPRGHYFIWHCGGFDKWWSTRKDKSLAGLQLEAMEWVMKQEKPKFFESQEKWKDALKSVGMMADEIRKTKKPIAVEHRVFFFSK